MPDVPLGDPPRRDPQRLFTAAQRALIAARQHHACSVCAGNLPDVFHVHHVIPWAEGGLTREDNGTAVCPTCHLNAPIRPLLAFVPRDWQEKALPVVLGKLRAGEFATLNAAPGAGKTLFATWVYRNLVALGVVARIVVFVPNTHLRTQWLDAVKASGVFLAAGSVTEPRDRDGVVLGYHVLSDPKQVEQIIIDAARLPTLFVLDEVHHLAMNRGGEAGAWAVNIGRIVGSVDRPEHPVFNLSGTLFRSNRTEQITTIKYEAVGDKIETVADYSVTAGQLIARQELRHIKVLGYAADMTVEAVDLAASAHVGAELIRAIDIDGNAKLPSGVLSELVRNPRFVHGIVAETVNRLGHASVALEGAPVKGLIVADGIDHAEQVYEELVSAIGRRLAFIAHGRITGADEQIELFRKSSGQAIMVAVQKVTEGFDVPDICVLTYLRTWRAPLFVNQMVGRAMRVTARECDLDTILPATVLLPNDQDVKAAFADVLVGAMQVLASPPEPCRFCGRDICACPPRRGPQKQCNRCGMPWRECVCPCDRCGLSRYRGCRCPRPLPGWKPPPQVDVVSDPTLVHVNVDGSDVDLHIVSILKDHLVQAGLNLIHIEQVAHAVQESMDDDPMTFMSRLRREEPK